MKKLLIIVAVIAVLGIVGLGVLFMNLGKIVKKGVETAGPPVTKTEVKLDSVLLSPFSGSGKLKGLFVGNPEGYKTPSAIKMGEIEVVVQIASLKSDIIVIDKVAINAPEITFEGGLTGSNLKKILANVEAATGGPSKTGSKSETKMKIKDLTITGGKISFSITGMGGKTLSAPLPDLHLTNIGTDDKGATVAQVTKQVLGEVVGNVDKIAAKLISEVGNMGKEAVKGATDQLNKATKGVKGLFK
jgi:hypothetical protein